ncbi:MAG: hypothetical protein ACXQS8_06900 [Candidatus Helarchaeales archaeon]
MGCGCPFTYQEILKELGMNEDEARAEAWKTYYMSDEEFAKYPWDQCIRDMTKKYGSKKIAQKICGKIRASRHEMSLQECVRAKIKIIKQHHPEMKQKQIVAYAYNFCRRHGNDPNA